MTATDPIAIANRAQGTAILPDVSVWVTASAGSGKTKVLTDRVLALLLAGTPPQRILGLTFTKAAAAEMSNRINTTLAGWVTKDDDALYADISRLARAQVEGASRETVKRMMDHARRLFAFVLDAPGGLQISTLHAFCQSLLRRFPLEVRVPPHFALMDDRDTSEALERALESSIIEARQDNSDVLSNALSILTARVHETHFSDLMQALVSSRAKLKRMIGGDLDAAIAAMRRHLGLKPHETEAQLISAACPDDSFECEALRHAVEALSRGTKTDQDRGRGIGDWLASPQTRAETFDAYVEHYLTKGAVRARLATKDVAAQLGVLDSLQREANRLEALVQRIKAARVAEGTAAMMRLGARVLDIYEDEKIGRGLLDYDDLIQTTRLLLSQPGVADWVLYKLDGGIDHILIDEAQDTNPEQWDIVDPIRREFFAGIGQRANVIEQPRTVFAVGDRKQSIYSFQGAAPETFDAVHARIRTDVHAAEQRWQDVTMNVSFRSAPVVLTAVNAVFAPGNPARNGVAGADEDITHLSAREGAGGLVEIWPPVAAEAGDETPSWKPPVERQKGDSPQNRLAAMVARRIHQMVENREILSSQNRPIRPGDIMVLVRRRTGFVEELVRQLKKLGVAVAGVDRMVLTAQMPIMDLIALGQLLLLPEDDLTLATVLKGPLLGLSEEELFDLAHGRGEQRLWEALATHAGRDTPTGAAHRYLIDLMGLTDYRTPAELYAHVLVTNDGRRKLLARLGMDADDPIDEFINLALAYQASHPPTLQGFLHWLAAGETEIKRDLEQGGDAVRVITVHGSKGLQAPIVFLPDTAQTPAMRDALLWSDGNPALLLWAAKVDDLDPITAELRDRAKAAQEREYNRLLYVAMTRAEDRLYVCGWQGKRAAKLDDTWYGYIKAGIAALPQAQSFIAADVSTDVPCLRLEGPQRAVPHDKRVAAALTAAAPLPMWATTLPPAEASPPRPLAPSRAIISEPAALSPLTDDGKTRYQRGIIIHRLLQSLPDIAPAKRRPAAEAFVKRPGWALTPESSADIVSETLAVLDNPAFAPLFAPGSRAEVSVSGLVGKHAISAQVDRLAVTPDEVWIIDYKTNRPAPRDRALVDAAYVLQMATYRAALQAIYPTHHVHCVLLWTDGPFTMELDSTQMDEALRRAGLR